MKVKFERKADKEQLLPQDEFKVIAPNDKNNVFIDFVYENYRDQLYLDENLENALKLTDKLVKIEVGSLTEKTTTNKVSRSRKKPDYDEINRKKGIQGALAEKKVLEYELELLKDVSLPKNKKPKIVSKNSSLGYDILSYTLDGKPKKIEVKSKSGGSLTNIDFFITQNEYQKIEEAKEKKEIFSIYYVFSLYKNPKFIEIEWKDIMNLKNEVVAYRYLLTTK
ncbi:DUF3883 domain-containing protein [Acholeplasma equirhinis]|uniref:DUF3883 domain-containing protein n=1 Tax=Acholeplasma equirhinis TaxID=555393 RepID=UPI00197A8B16|nr:DUF3883 domain-containing protein [Acholeplasma equirhinis]MBN3490256.1 DUF3883 domain-containing protein [Acholeplasma equirhinis]